MQVHPKIALIGCENVAAASAYSLMNGPMAVDVILFGDRAPDLLSTVEQIIDKVGLSAASSIGLGCRNDIAEADVCVLSSGGSQTLDETEEAFILKNISAVREDSRFLKNAGFDGVLVVTTSPAEIMAQAAMEECGLPTSRIIGIGPNMTGIFQNATMREMPAATWCSAAGCGADFIDSCDPDCPYFENILKQNDRHQHVPDRPPMSTMASCVMRVCEAIIGNEKAVLSVAAMLMGQHAIKGVFATVPCVIGREGIVSVVELGLSETERESMLSSARDTGQLYHRLTKKMTATATVAIQ